MTALLALVMAVLSFGTLNPTTLHVRAHPACSIAKDPNGGCASGADSLRKHVEPDCSVASNPDGCGM